MLHKTLYVHCNINLTYNFIRSIRHGKMKDKNKIKLKTFMIFEEAFQLKNIKR